MMGEAIHTPGPWPSMKERKSCRCCMHYEPGLPCPFYTACKGSNSGAGPTWWVYDERREEMALADDRLRDRLRVLGLDQSVL